MTISRSKSKKKKTWNFTHISSLKCAEEDQECSSLFFFLLDSSEETEKNSHITSVFKVIIAEVLMHVVKHDEDVTMVETTLNELVNAVISDKGIGKFLGLKKPEKEEDVE